MFAAVPDPLVKSENLLLVWAIHAFETNSLFFTLSVSPSTTLIMPVT
ncbi:hypothetical protein LBWT_X3580 (plasmid) [Leptolyngbya boryana IAM M-101]|nr:hypothetical protein LBWT_X3580 [Leptolyngbya boryana IAM M-101]BAS66634.1 hypothetical protein LBDG_X3580 [Leptolyngbya boryana dg5]